ncbi:MAG: sigma-70 family RNA polymerase sigma factor [Spirochaetota bacterium]|nr:MAG: sigma-70 family RNA polymerase sigma factor [Spirochaetota bacterium]
MPGKEYSFDNIFLKYKPQIHRYLSRLVGFDEAEDLTQEVFVKVNKALPNFHGRSKLSTWIYRIATNTAIDKVRSPSFKRTKVFIPEQELIAEDENVGNDKKVLSMDQQIIEKEMNECIRYFICHLPENYRTVLVLSELECLKNKELAEILDITLDTVKIRLHRARARLKKELECHCDFYHTDDNQLACEPNKSTPEFK